MDQEQHASDEDSPLTVSEDFEKLIDSVTSQGEWTDILENKQLLKQTIKPGDQNEGRPQRSNKVTVTVKAKLLGQGDSLVESECLEKAEIFVSEYDVMHGVDLAIPLMYPGETARVLIHPRFGYSGAGKEPDVPPNAAFDCEITLHSIEYVECETGLPIEERIKFGKLSLCLTFHFILLPVTFVYDVISFSFSLLDSIYALIRSQFSCCCCCCCCYCFSPSYLSHH